MEKQDALKRVQSLRELLNTANTQYYDAAQPLMSDLEYDKLMDELLSLELAFDLQTPDSPSVRIGGKTNKTFATVVHTTPLLSLSNTYNEGEVLDFDRRIRELLGHNEFTYSAELKYDGMAIRLVYSNGQLTLAATRGNGIEGDDITANCRTIRDIPLSLKSIPFKGDLDIRGEAFMEREAFVLFNEQREVDGEQAFANPRNATAGSLKLQDPKVVASRPIRFFTYDLLAEQAPKDFTQTQKLDLLKQLGLPVCEHRKHCASIQDVIEIIKEWDTLRHTLPYDTDGVVVKVNEDRYRDVLGRTAKSPRWAIAYKYQSEQAVTRLNSITLQVGRLGTITPVAELEPVLLAGTTVKRASLHNEEEIQRKDIRVGDFVLIEKAGEIIPQVVSVKNPDDFTRGPLFEMPKNCPDCGSTLIKTEGEVAWRCQNPSCPPQLRHKIEHFASKQALYIDGLGEAIVDQLVSENLIRTYADLYDLQLEHLVTLERMGEKSAQNLLTGIQESKKRSFDRVLFGLGIRFVGTTVAKDLAQHFRSIDALMQATFDELIAVDSIGPKIAESILSHFSSQTNQELVQRLKDAGLQLHSAEKTITSNKFDGLIFVLTGTLPTMKREQAAQLIEDNGGKTSSSVSKKTSYVLAGDEAGSKLEKALALNVPVLNEAQFLDLLNKE